MKSIFSLRGALLVLVATACLAFPAGAEINPKPFVVPELTGWTGAEGHTALSGRIVVKSSKLRPAAESLAADYATMFGRRLTVATGRVRPGDVVLSLTADRSLGNEGYRLAVGPTVTIEADTERGAFWATRTLLQLTEQSTDRTLPCGSATDVPAYRLRGFMIDCGRKFFPMSYLRNLVKMMAYYKMNTLQVHLNDNGFRQYFDNDWSKTQAAFRLECNTYPGLTAKDGSYTKAEFIALQELAEANGVEIIPEIDVPAHSLALTHYRPELGSKDYGMDHLDLFNPKTYEFVDGLFREYLEGKHPVFRGPRVHIGTDEYSNAKQDVVEKFRAFTDHYIRFVEGYGKQAVVWGALTHAQGSTPVKSQGVLMNCWYNGYADPQEMKRLGYQLVSIPDGLVYIVPAAGYYYDYLDCKHLYDVWTPATIGNCRFIEGDPAIEGGMFAVWNDHPGNGITVQDVQHRVYPAMQTLAVKCWTGIGTSLPYETFDSLRTRLSEGPGVNELARLGQRGDTVLSLPVVHPGDSLAAEEIGYDYAVSFTIDPREEKPGTVLLRSTHAVFYLADPVKGLLGFEREGCLNTFDYRLKPGRRVTLTIEGNNRATRLLVDGQLQQELGPVTLYAVQPGDRANYQVPGASPWQPVVYAPKAKMHYQRTLVFPLRHAGQFGSSITDLRVVVK